MTDNNMTTKYGNIIYVILSLFTTTMFVDRFMKYGIVLLAVSFVIIMIIERRIFFHNNGLTNVFILIAFVSFVDFLLFSVYGFSPYGDTAVAIKEISRCVIYIILIQILISVKIDIKTYARVWKFLILFTVAVAIIQYVKIFDVDSILKSIYGDSIQFHNSAKEELSDFRGGSIFINANVFACFLVAALSSYLFISTRLKENILSKGIIFGAIFVGLILTGSRTGFILGIIILIVHMYLQSRGNIFSFFKKVFFLVVALVCILLTLLIFFDFTIDPSMFRIFKISEGIENSFGVKLDIYKTLIKGQSVFNMILGYGPFDYTLSPDLLVDFDFGYFTTFFGGCGLVLYLALIFSILHFGDYKNPSRKFLNTMFFVITIVFGFTAGVYFNLRIFSVYSLMFMPALYLKDEPIT